MAVMTIQSIVHPTDFTDLSGLAFCHALRIAVAAKSKLQLLHVSPHATVGALAFPQARRLSRNGGYRKRTILHRLLQTGLELKWMLPASMAKNQRKEFLNSFVPCRAISLCLRPTPRKAWIIGSTGPSQRSCRGTRL